MQNGRTERTANARLMVLGSALLSLWVQPARAQPSAPLPVPAPAPPASQQGHAKPAMAMGNPATWVTTSDYPAISLRNHEEGTTTFRLTISPQGRVSECMILSSSGSPSLDEATCALITRRALFRPAVDKRGKETTGNYNNRVRWTIPNGAATPFQIKPESIEISLMIEADGSATNCIKTVNGVRIDEQPQSNPCSTGVRFAPFVDAQGRAVRKQVTYQSVTKVTDVPQ